MTLTPEAERCLSEAMRALGLRPLRCGSVTLHFGQSGRLESVQEVRHTKVAHEPLDRAAERSHTQTR